MVKGLSAAPWNAEEVATLNRMREGGHTFDEMSEALGRTRLSIRTKLNRMKHGETVRTLKKWTQDELAQLLSFRDKYNLGWTEIGKRMGRPDGTVYSKYYYLKKLTTFRADGTVNARIPADREEEWRRRQALTPRSLTSALMGDPLPGYSALERRT